MRAYVDGINAYNREAGRPVKPWTVNNVISVASLIGAVFGKGGGDEARRAELLNALQQRLGAAAGEQVWNDLRELQDPEAPVTLERRFPYGRAPGPAAGQHRDRRRQLRRGRRKCVCRDGAARPARQQRAARGGTAFGQWASPVRRRAAGRLLLSGAADGGRPPRRRDRRSRGSLPGAGPYVLLGRGQDFAWSATSAGSDVIDQFVETLCGNDTTYIYRGRCVPMRTVRAGILQAGGGERRRALTFRETVHGPVIGYATRGGERVAISQRRSTRGRELVNALAFADLNANRPHSPKSFIRTMSQVEFTFNWFYADDRDIAMYSSGRLPLRNPGVDPGLPTIGTGRYEWRGFLPARAPPPADQRAQRRDPELEQQAGGGLRRLGQQLGLRLDSQGAAARGRDRRACPARTATRQADADLRRRGDEQSGDAGPAGGEALALARGRAGDRTGSQPAGRAHAEAAARLAHPRREPARPRARRQDRPPRRGDHGCRLAEDRRRGHGSGARPSARRASRS